MYAWLNMPCTCTGFSSVSVALMAAASLAETGCTASAAVGWWATGGRGICGTCSIGLGGARGAAAAAAAAAALDLGGAGEREWAAGADTGAGTVMGADMDVAVVGGGRELASAAAAAAERATALIDDVFDEAAVVRHGGSQ